MTAEQLVTPIFRSESVSALETTEKPRHRWYFFKEAFSPEIVGLATQDSGCTLGDIVLDPFSGSGTTPLEAAIQGYKSVGYEVNPFLKFVAQTKLRNCSQGEIKILSGKVLGGAERGSSSPLEEFSTFSERAVQGRNAGKWLFNSEVLRAFDGGWRVVEGQASAAGDFARLSLIGAAMDVANAVKDGKCLRYISDWQKSNFGKAEFLTAFTDRMSAIAQDIEACPLADSVDSVRLGDSRQITPGEKFKLCITSPPYLNSFDYTDIYRPELFLGRFVRDMQELRSLRLRTLRSHVQVAWETPTEAQFGRRYLDVIDRIREDAKELWNSRIPLMIQAYFEDMANILRRLHLRARKDASLWIVVSTSAYAGIEIPVDLILADIACQNGWYLREVSVIRHLGRVAGQQWTQLSERNATGKPHLRESVVILDASPRKSHKSGSARRT